ncbi:MAG: hypothetical protein ABL961_01850 [Vicinamibacterales bacterium]
MTEAEFDSIVRSRQGIAAALSIEEKFNVVLENFREYELELLSIAQSRLVFSQNDWSRIQDDIHTVNRRLMNLLSAIRLFLDHVDRELHELYGPQSIPAQVFSEERGKEYDGRLSFRTMEAIRNYTQHRSFPVHELSFLLSADTDGNNRHVRHTITPSLSVASLQADPKFKKSVAAELKPIGKMVQITPMIREYVESIGRIHVKTRSLMAADVETWDATMEQAVGRGKAFFGDDLGIALVRIEGQDEEETWTSTTDLFVDSIHRRRYLQGRSSHAEALARHYVSSKPNP